MKKRNTKQKQLICEAISKLDHPRAEDIYNYVKELDPKIGKATVYRNLQLMLDEESLRKIELDNVAVRYDCIMKNHHHFKCRICQKLYDLEEGDEKEIANHLIEEVIYKGLCHNCR